MLRLAWMNGSIPADLHQLAALVRVRPTTLQKMWGNLSKLWIANDPADPSRLRNKKQESERFFLESKRKSASESSKLRWNKQKQKENADANVLPRQSFSQPNPTQPNKEKKNPPADAAADLFADTHVKQLGVPYISKRADFIKLAEIRKAHNIAARASPDGWQYAVENYFASPLSAYTLADLASRFPTFRNTRLDRYGKPVNHENSGGSNGTTKTQQNRQAAERLRARLDSEDGSSSVSDDLRRDSGGLS
jgi:hypothetical protein